MGQEIKLSLAKSFNCITGNFLFPQIAQAMESMSFDAKSGFHTHFVT
jgi:hypothetical protein